MVLTRFVPLIAVCLIVSAESGLAANDSKRPASFQRTNGEVTVSVERLSIQRVIAESPIVKRYGLERTVSVLISMALFRFQVDLDLALDGR